MDHPPELHIAGSGHLEPRLQRLVATARDHGRLADDPAAAGNPHLSALLAEELAASEALPLPLTLPHPADPRLWRLIAALLANPQDWRSLAAWAGELGLSQRNLIRRFRAETGLTFREWRRQARLLAALERLGAGQPVTAVAFEVGYENVFF